jgi:hypothetical protein
MLPKSGRQKIIKDSYNVNYSVQQKDKDEEFFNQTTDPNGRRSAVVGQLNQERLLKPQFTISPRAYNHIKGMSGEEREDYYKRMGIPSNIKRRRLYFISINMFS